MENDHHWTTSDVSKDDAIMWRIPSLHTCHASSDNINGSKLGSRSMVTAEAIFCVKLRKNWRHMSERVLRLCSILLSLWHGVTCVIMPGMTWGPGCHLCHYVRLWPEWRISWKIPHKARHMDTGDPESDHRVSTAWDKPGPARCVQTLMWHLWQLEPLC